MDIQYEQRWRILTSHISFLFPALPSKYFSFNVAEETRSAITSPNRSEEITTAKNILVHFLVK